jgi:DNA-directed RNA polymerase subunit RPC12/RpoP
MAEYTCAYCQAVFEEERQLLEHFCPEREAAEKSS